MAVYGILASALGVLAMAAVLAAAIWAGVAMQGRGRNFVVSGLGLTLLSRIAMGVFPFLVSVGGEDAMMAAMSVQVLLGALGTVGLLLVVAGAVFASKDQRPGQPPLRPMRAEQPGGHQSEQNQSGQWHNPYEQQ